MVTLEKCGSDSDGLLKVVDQGSVRLNGGHEVEMPVVPLNGGDLVGQALSVENSCWLRGELAGEQVAIRGRLHRQAMEG